MKRAPSLERMGQRIGRFELAPSPGRSSWTKSQSLPLELQPKLLRVLQDGQFESWADRVPSNPISGWWRPPIAIFAP